MTIFLEQKNKAELRKSALSLRQTLVNSGDIKIISSIITSKILNSKDFKNAKNIALYHPYKGEVDILGLLNICDKNFYFPACLNNEMEFYKYTGEFKQGQYGIYEANGQKILASELDIIYIPALMANNQNYRLGYGKGYYDRFFAKYQTRAKKIIIVPSKMISNASFQNNFDYRCDGIITE